MRQSSGRAGAPETDNLSRVPVLTRWSGAHVGVQAACGVQVAIAVVVHSSFGEHLPHAVVDVRAICERANTTASWAHLERVADEVGHSVAVDERQRRPAEHRVQMTVQLRRLPLGHLRLLRARHLGERVPVDGHVLVGAVRSVLFAICAMLSDGRATYIHASAHFSGVTHLAVLSTVLW